MRLLFEGFVLALQELWNHKTRSLLSVMGISIGIFCVISVQMMLDSVEQNIRQSFQRLGNDVVFIDKFPWNEDPGASWWKYIKRPYVSYDEYKVIKENVPSAEKVAIRLLLREQEIKHKEVVLENVFMAAPTHDFADIVGIELFEGRWFSQVESQLGSPAVVLGYKVAKELFDDPARAVGNNIRVMGRKTTVTGVLKEEGKSILGDGFDNIALVPFNYMRRYVSAQQEKFMPLIVVKTAQNASVEQLKDEVTGTLRSKRKLHPAEEDNFAINQISILTGVLDAVFAIVHLAGWLIGIFSILVGGFGIANIMFVSVKERTGIIGIKKSLGAKSHIILFEFLVEAIFLCLAGGLLGIALVWATAFAGNWFIDSFELVLSSFNMMIGFALSFVIGVVAGIIPAVQAARMNPVEAIRHNF